MLLACISICIERTPTEQNGDHKGSTHINTSLKGLKTHPQGQSKYVLKTQCIKWHYKDKAASRWSKQEEPHKREASQLVFQFTSVQPVSL